MAKYDESKEGQQSREGEPVKNLSLFEEQDQDAPQGSAENQHHTKGSMRVGKKRTLRDKWRLTSLPNKVITIATVVIAGAGLLTFGAAIFQWLEMRGAGKQTDKLISAANIQASAATKNVESATKMALAADKQAGAAITQADSMTKLVGQASAAVVIQKQAAKAQFGAHIQIHNLYMYHSETDKKVWAVVELENDGPGSAPSVSIAAKLAFLDKSPEKSRYAFTDFKNMHPPELPPFRDNKAYTTSLPDRIELSPTEGQGTYLCIWGVVSYKDFQRSETQLYRFCRFALTKNFWAVSPWPAAGLGGRPEDYTNCDPE